MSPHQNYTAFTDRHDNPAHPKPRRHNTNFEDFVPKQQLSSMKQEDSKVKARTTAKIKHVARSLVRKVKEGVCGIGCWILGGGGNSRFDVIFDGGAADSDRMVGIFSLYAPDAATSLKTAVKLYPSLTYSLSFQMRGPYSTDSSVYMVFVAGENKRCGS
ncbi:hypothetical protein T440DRAFT_478798 [Plenodomus tracheiphilus IPT5]|uniref:Uncharacterized protein n=1 Tax=Plenodomus tracheiphilus IPT5 TaxID=1408161 RepID=A0A6A7B5V6_9PLEO|nr:hypothetical protein T440DRAFT_478798 [Plenodomus tracheiphilus IPT5]